MAHAIKHKSSQCLLMKGKARLSRQWAVQ